LNDKIEINKLIKESKITKKTTCVNLGSSKKKMKKEITFKKGKTNKQIQANLLNII